MQLCKILLLLFSVSFSYSKKENAFVNTVNPDLIKSWEVEDHSIDNPEIKKALDRLKSEFIDQKKKLDNKYKLRIDELKNQKKMASANLKKQFSEKRNALKEKYGLNNKGKPKKLKASKKAEKLPKKKSSNVNYINKSPLKKTSQAINKDNNSEKIKEDEKK